MSLIDVFKAKIAAPDFEAQGTVTGSLSMTYSGGQSTSPVTGTFKVKGADSAGTNSTTLLGMSSTNEDIVVAGWEYTRSNGGAWQRTPATNPTLGQLLTAGQVTDRGLVSKFGKQLHCLALVLSGDADLAAIGIHAEAGQTISDVGISFWAEVDGTPAGISVQETVDQDFMGKPMRMTLIMDVRFDVYSGVVITPPATWAEASPTS